MMKVYVALAGYDYEGDEIMGVYSSRELAENCIKGIKEDYDYTTINEWDVDDKSDPLD